MVIAIDGPAGAGKSTVARGVAAALGITYLDSGAMYRCVALASLHAGLDPGDVEAVTGVAERVRIGFEGERVLLDDEDVTSAIRDQDVTAAASRVSVHPGVRAAMVARQRELIEWAPYVAEGRDIGTVVSPDAPLKVFLTADEEERARRRAAETGEQLDAVLAGQRERDARDREREHGALRPADDSVELDMHAPPHFLFDHPQLRPHAVPPGLPSDQELARAALAADEGEVEEAEGLRFTEPATPAAFRPKASELDQPGLLGM